jgi:hypothetical protein
MAPGVMARAASLARRAAGENPSVSSALRTQWQLPGDILSFLLVGGDVVQSAMAQVAGHIVTPVTAMLGAAAGRLA